MQRTEYTCDWCHKPTHPRLANQLTVSPALVRLAGANSPDPMDRVETNLDILEAHERRRFSADICDSCFALFREWIAGRQSE